MDDKLKQLLERLLRATVPLAEAPASSDTKFLPTLLGIYRVSLSTLRDIYYLSQNEDSGLNILDLARKITEYGISVEYMLFKGKEEMATRFQDHLWTQTHQEFTFLKSIGEDESKWEAEIKNGAEEAEERFAGLNHDARERRTWAGKDLDSMLKELYDNGALKYFDHSRIGQMYVWGSRANHPNPFIVINYLENEDQKVSNNFYFRLGIVTALSFHIRLTTRLIDEIRSLSGKNDHQEVTDNVLAIYEEMDKLGENGK